MKRFKLSGFGVFILSSLLIVSTAFAGSLPEVWTEIDPVLEYPDFEFNGLTPACSNAPGTADDDFTFFVKGGKSNNLVIFFQGGGGCWDSMNCIFAPTYTQRQDEELGMFSDENKGYGLFDTTEQDNPFKDWGFVYIPYCTGDLFWGANDKDYLVGFDPATGPIYNTIQHRGFVNFQAVLKYLEDNGGYPGKIFVTGSSAGSYGATLAFPYIKDVYPWANTYLLGDAGAGVMGGTFPTEGIKNWNVQMPEWIFPDGYYPELTFDQVYADIAAEYPLSRLAQYTTAFDGTQIFFLNVMKNIHNPYAWNDPAMLTEAAMEWHPTMRGYAYSAAASSNYRYYIAAGTDHTIMMSPKFYTEDSGGVSFADWVAGMMKNPKKWKNQECEVCLP